MSKKGAPPWAVSLFTFLRSIKLAVFLILYIAATSLLSSFIPQNQVTGFYLAEYPDAAAWIIIALGFDHFFRSFLFLAPVALFFLNLSTCTIHRFRTRLKNKAKRRYGPDILHLGLLIIIVGAVVSALGRVQGMVWFSPGDKGHLPGGYVLTLERFEFLKYENGASKDWISTVSVEKNGQVIRQSVPIEVNKPLKLGNVKVYQTSYKNTSFILVRDRDEKMYKVSAGEWIPRGDDIYVLKEVKGETAYFDLYRKQELVDQVDYSVDDAIGPYYIAELEASLASGLQMVIDPGYYPMLIGLLLLAFGLFLTYIQKIGDNNI